jgi:transcriptional regulator with XRE-family HTH domain
MSDPEHVRAKAWRLSHGLTQKELGRMIGYSASGIHNLEAGRHRYTGVPTKPKDMLRYKMACAAVASGLTFDWDRVTIRLD